MRRSSCACSSAQALGSDCAHDLLDECCNAPSTHRKHPHLQERQRNCNRGPQLLQANSAHPVLLLSESWHPDSSCICVMHRR